MTTDSKHLKAYAFACPECGQPLNVTMDYTPRGWIDEGGYWPAEIDRDDHQVRQPTGRDRRTNAPFVVCGAK
jgi:hypothetical protein